MMGAPSPVETDQLERRPGVQAPGPTSAISVSVRRARICVGAGPGSSRRARCCAGRSEAGRHLTAHGIGSHAREAWGTAGPPRPVKAIVCRAADLRRIVAFGKSGRGAGRAEIVCDAGARRHSRPLRTCPRRTVLSGRRPGLGSRATACSPAARRVRSLCSGLSASSSARSRSLPLAPSVDLPGGAQGEQDLPRPPAGEVRASPPAQPLEVVQALREVGAQDGWASPSTESRPAASTGTASSESGAA